MFLLLVYLCILYPFGMTAGKSKRSFVIDYENNRFLKDGKPFRYVSGGIHYFRVREEDWEDRFYKIRKSGCNAIQTYIAWNVHETYKGKFTNLEKLTRFIKLAQSHDLLVILRPGPYICAEWEFGGFPYWLIKDKSIKVRTSEKHYIEAVENWSKSLFSVIRPLLYSNGGPIIMVQVENEYGSYGCDHAYMDLQKDIFVKYLGDQVIYFTTDGAGEGFLKCGATSSLYSTIDFGAGGSPAQTFHIQRVFQPQGPYVNSEYYTGWLDHWGEPHQTRSAKSIADSLDKILAVNASVNMYMFEGGTNFGFMNGANEDGVLQPQPTSYDYDAPLSEAGDPTEKYFLIQKTLAKYIQIPAGPQPKASEKAAYGKVDTVEVLSVFELIDKATPVENLTPLSFESLDAPYGYVLYRTSIPQELQKYNNIEITLMKYRDRASIFIDEALHGILQTSKGKNSMVVSTGKTLDILVENQGRVNYGPYLADTEKGLLNDVQLNGSRLLNWKMYHVDGSGSVIKGAQNLFNISSQQIHQYSKKEFCLPAVAIFSFHVSEAKDTYLKLDAWTKGFVIINGFNLGRYWTPVGPQKTLYVPRHVLSDQTINRLIIFETDKITKDIYIEFVDKPILG